MKICMVVWLIRFRLPGVDQGDRLACAVMRFGIELDDTRALRGGRSSDAVAVVMLRSWLANLPRTSSAVALSKRIVDQHGDVDLIPFAWHYVTHTPEDGLSDRATRAVPGEGPHGHLRGEPAGGKAWNMTLEMAERIGANAVALATPVSFSPGAVGRRRLSEFSARSRLPLVWEPQGLWDSDLAVRVASPLGVSVMVRGLGLTGRPAETHGAGFIRVHGGRLPARLAEALVAELEDQECTVICAGQGAYSNVRALSQALASLSS
jgi:hypothetical protein